ncbi:MAG: lysoplasmalogenase [Sneathiella sp.]
MLGSKYKASFLIPLSLFSAILYLIAPVAEGSLAYIGLKATTCIALACFAFLNIPSGRLQKSVTLALLVSSLGDIFLAIRTTDYFVEGLGSFLIAHLIYISVFFHGRNPDQPSKGKIGLMGAIIVIAGGVVMYLWPSLGALKAPVGLYIMVITLMAIAAIYSRFDGKLVISGAIIFMLSDALIALNKFIAPIPGASIYIWITYVSAQILITAAVIRGSAARRAETVSA